MKILTGSTDYILEQTKHIKTACYKTAHIPLNNLAERAAFLKQTPALGDFVACDENGNVLEEPIESDKTFELYKTIYEQAQAKVIFKGFLYDWHMEYCHNGIISFDEEFLQGKTIEDLVPYNLEMI